MFASLSAFWAYLVGAIATTTGLSITGATIVLIIAIIAVGYIGYRGIKWAFNRFRS